jgi:hypothetical protein
MPRRLDLSRRQVLVSAASAGVGVAVGVGIGGCGRRTKDGSAGSSPPAKAPPSAPTAKASTSATLLAGANFTCAAAHPREPWLATGSMTPGSDATGQIVAWDLVTGAPRHAHLEEEGGIGFEPRERMIAWAPTGRRIAASAGTNAIVVVEDGAVVCRALPDGTQDHPVPFCWLGTASSLYAAAFGQEGAGPGAIVAVDGAGAMTWLPQGVPPQLFRRVVYNRETDAIVGDDLHIVAALDPAKRALRYLTPLAAVLRPTITTPLAWSADGRRLAVAAAPVDGESAVSVVDADDGRIAATVSIPGTVDALRWSAASAAGGHRLAVVAGPSYRAPRVVHLVDGVRVVRAFDVAIAVQNHDLPDARSIDWSPTADRLAVLRTDGTVALFDAADGRPRTPLTPTREHGEPHLGVIWGQGDRVVGLAADGLTIWSTDGKVVAAHGADAR